MDLFDPLNLKKLGFLFGLPRGFDAASVVSDASLLSVGLAHSANVDRIHALWRVVYAAYDAAFSFQQAVERVNLSRYGTTLPTLDQQLARARSHDGPFDREAAIEEYLSPKLPQTLDKGPVAFRPVAHLESLSIMQRDPHSRTGLEAMLGAILGLAWTAFESLATDAWKAAVNQRPASLGISALAAPKRGIAEDGEDQADQSKRNAVPVESLAEFGFNLSDRFGDMLWRRRHFDFNSLQGLKDAYRNTFRIRDPGKNWRNAPEPASWFSGDGYDDLRLLEALRHVLVHRGGRVDQSFLDRIEQISPELAKIPKDSVVPLDGELVYRCVTAASSQGKIVLEGVNSWLLKNLS